MKIPGIPIPIEYGNESQLQLGFNLAAWTQTKVYAARAITLAGRMHGARSIPELPRS